MKYPINQWHPKAFKMNTIRYFKITLTLNFRFEHNGPEDLERITSGWMKESKEEIRRMNK